MDSPPEPTSNHDGSILSLNISLLSDYACYIINLTAFPFVLVNGQASFKKCEGDFLSTDTVLKVFNS